MTCSTKHAIIARTSPEVVIGRAAPEAVIALMAPQHVFMRSSSQQLGETVLRLILAVRASVIRCSARGAAVLHGSTTTAFVAFQRFACQLLL